MNGQSSEMSPQPAVAQWPAPFVGLSEGAVDETSLLVEVAGEPDQDARLGDDPEVAAVVLRADSPGGDPLPSDLVAEAVTMLRDAGKWPSPG